MFCFISFFLVGFSSSESGLWVETQEAVATIVNADTNNGQVAKGNIKQACCK